MTDRTEQVVEALANVISNCEGWINHTKTARAIIAELPDDLRALLRGTPSDEKVRAVVEAARTYCKAEAGSLAEARAVSALCAAVHALSSPSGAATAEGGGE